MASDTQTLIHHFLEKSAWQYPNKIALIHDEVRATYAQINSGANQLAHWLIQRGIEKGDRVVLILENSLEYVISYYGTLKAGAVVAPLSSDIKPDGLRPLLRGLEPEVVISSSRFEKLLLATDLSQFKIKALILKNPVLNSASAPCEVFSWQDLIGNRESPNPDMALDKSVLSNIIYTSASTGRPKGVMLSHWNIVSNVHAICQYLNLTEKDIQMVVLPFFYVMGKSLLNTHFAVGGTIVLNNKFAFPASMLKQMVDEHVSGFSGVPSTYAYLLHRSPLAKYRDRLNSLRYCSQAGGHMSRQIKEELRRVLPTHTQIYIMYGATEASARLAYLEPGRFREKMDSIGKPIPGVSLQVIDTAGQGIPPGHIGELVASGSNIMQGYWKDEKATKKVLYKSGYHTGDMAYEDEEGFFYVVGRNDDLLKVGGHRINPREIEDTLMETGLLMEAAVIGIPDTLLGFRLIGLVTSKEEKCNQKQVLSLCADKLPKYKMPGEIRFVRSLPKRISGKIDRTRCLDLAYSASK